MLALPAAGGGAELEAEIDAAIASAEMAGYAKVLCHQTWDSNIRILSWCQASTCMLQCAAMASCTTVIYGSQDPSPTQLQDCMRS